MFLFDQIKRGDTALRAVAIGVAGGMVVLLTALWYVQVVSASRYRADLQEQALRIVRVPAIRGKILDRNGFALADNRPSYNINLYLEEFRRQFRFEYTNHILAEYRQLHPKSRVPLKVDQELQTIARCVVVSNLLMQVGEIVQQPQIFDKKQFTNHYDNLRSLPFPLVRDLSVQQVALFTERSSDLPNLALEVQPVRTYPWTNTAAQLIGHLKRENRPSEDEEIAFQFRLPDFVGVMGIEKEFDPQLRGRPGIKSVLVNNMQYRQAEEVLTPPQSGKNVVLTLDLPIQRAAESALRKAGPNPGAAAVVLDCRNGDVLALASYPAFDPNTFLTRISEEDWAKMNDPQELPQVNRATHGTYPPGSIFKIIVSLACLEAGTLQPDERFEAKAQYQIGGKGRPWHCTAGPGLFDFDQAFYLSCNCYFIDHGLKTGFEKVAEMGRRFGLGTRTGLNTHMEVPGYFPDPNEKLKTDGGHWMPGDTANLCIGQGELRVTPLQMAIMTAAVANGGRLLEPRLVDRIEPPDAYSDEESIHFPPGQTRAPIHLDPKNLSLVRNAMLLDVTHTNASGRADGTGRRAAVEGLQVCGKTGTAQIKQGGELKGYITWFASFAPFDAPRYVVLVMIEAGMSGSGAVTCAPVAHDIYETILKRELRAAPTPKVSFSQR